MRKIVNGGGGAEMMKVLSLVPDRPVSGSAAQPFQQPFQQQPFQSAQAAAAEQRAAAAAEAAREMRRALAGHSKMTTPPQEEKLRRTGTGRENGVAANKSSKYRGVSLTRKTDRWLALQTFGGKQMSLGSFGSEEEAARACDRVQLWSCKADGKKKEEVTLNFPLSDYGADEVAALQSCTQEDMLLNLRRAAKQTRAATVDSDAAADDETDEDANGAGRGAGSGDVGFQREASSKTSRKKYTGATLDIDDELTALQGFAREDMLRKLRQTKQEDRVAKQSSEYTGVSLVKSTGRWQTRCWIDVKTTTLGTFGSEEEAARAWDRMRLWLYKARGKKKEEVEEELNFPLSEYSDAEVTALQGLTQEEMLKTRRLPSVASRASKYRGVSLAKSTGRWQARCRIGGKQTSLGNFGSEEEAARAVDRMKLWAYTDGKMEEVTERELNFPLSEYSDDERGALQGLTQEEMIQKLRRTRQEERVAKQSSKYTGVSLVKKSGRWEAQCKIGGKSTSLGQFANEEEAARAVDRMQLWSCKADGREKEEVKLNFPLSEYSDDEVAALQSLTREEIIQKLRRKEERVAKQSSKYTGVTLYTRTGRWKAQCAIGGKTTSLGYFDSEEEAARAWDRMRLWSCKADGKRKEEVQLNFPLSEYSAAEVTALQGLTQEEIIEKLRRTEERVASQASKYRGVYLIKSTGRWQAQYWIGGKHSSLGTFGSEEEAARAWDRMRLWSCKADGKKKEEVQLNLPLSDYSDDDVTALQSFTQEDMLLSLRRTDERVANKWSGYTGVTLDTRTGRWLARCRIGGKQTSLGYFVSEEEAARAWDRMRLWSCKADGKRKEEVNLNFPLSDYSDAEGFTQEEIIQKLRRTRQEERVANQTSKYTGVSLDARTGRWRAQCTIGGKKTYMGTFGSEEEAARAWDRMRLWSSKTDGNSKEALQLNFPLFEYSDDDGCMQEEMIQKLRRTAKQPRSEHSADGVTA
jgi:hypothetical protein